MVEEVVLLCIVMSQVRISVAEFLEGHAFAHARTPIDSDHCVHDVHQDYQSLEHNKNSHPNPSRIQYECRDIKT